MAFATKDLSLMAYTGAGDGSQFWFHANSEEDSTPETSGYFDDAADRLRKGDLIYDVYTGKFLRVTSDTGAATVTTEDLIATQSA